MFEILKGRLNETKELIDSKEKSIVIRVKELKWYLLKKENIKNYIIPYYKKIRQYIGNDILWLLPLEADSTEKAIMLKSQGSEIVISRKLFCFEIEIKSAKCEVLYFENRPCCDVFGNKIILNIDKGPLFTKILGAFYWDSMLPMVIERTKASKFKYKDGYVLSTLKKGAYPGTYPDVDHEFQIKGRIAMADPLDIDIVKRMIELQIQVMSKNPDGEWRNPCSIQPRGNCEYHVRRKSLNKKNEANMFLLTGNIEIIESIWLYISRTKDFKWLKGNIENIENIAKFIESHIDKDYRLWSDVYYEDQVMKDGRETIAQAFAANSFNYLSSMEKILGRDGQSERYLSISQKLAETLIKPLPLGFWDEKNKMFIDWVDRKNEVHDHIHLLANSLPVLFNYADDEQKENVINLINEHIDIFQKFPSFVSAKIEDYTKDEMGTGGPYDLCAAGRYWCWDAAYWSSLNSRKNLKEQLEKVALQAIEDGYMMSERYDMNHVYYINDKNWHGCSKYYEYPNVFAWVLINEYLGIKPSINCDWVIQPKLDGYGVVTLNNINLGYKYAEDEFTVYNLKDAVNLKLDLNALYPVGSKFILKNNILNEDEIIELDKNETLIINVER